MIAWLRDTASSFASVRFHRLTFADLFVAGARFVDEDRLGLAEPLGSDLRFDAVAVLVAAALVFVGLVDCEVDLRLVLVMTVPLDLFEFG